MENKKIKALKYYRNILMEIKKAELNYMLSSETENRFPSFERSHQKVKTLFKRT